jgi:hypothetical protein
MSYHTKEDSQTLLNAYVAICNQALQENKDIFPYKSMIEAIHHTIEGKKIALSLIDDEPKVIACLSLEKDGVKLLPLDTEENQFVKINMCHLKMSYLKNVIDNPQEYIKNPAKIDWRWIENIAYTSE